MKILVVSRNTYWRNVISEMLTMSGFDCDLLSTRPRRAYWRWLLTGQWRKYDMIYQVCGEGNWWMNLLLTPKTMPFVIHWIGTDVLSYLEGKSSQGWRNLILSRFFSKKQLLRHISDSPDLHEELCSAGIDTKVVRLIPEKVQSDVLKLPETFSVLSYWSDETMGFYNGSLVFRLAEAFPHVPFRIVGANGSGVQAPDNVTFLGRCDLENVYRDVSVLIRMPEHDSLGMMVLEMLARGRYVIYNKKVECCHFSEDFEQAKTALEEILQKQVPNVEGSAFVRDNFSREKEAIKLKQVINNLV